MVSSVKKKEKKEKNKCKNHCFFPHTNFSDLELCQFLKIHKKLRIFRQCEMTGNKQQLQKKPNQHHMRTSMSPHLLRSNIQLFCDRLVRIQKKFFSFFALFDYSADKT